MNTSDVQDIWKPRLLTWKPIRGPIKTTVPLKGGYMGFHVSLGECTNGSRFLAGLQEKSGPGGRKLPPSTVGRWTLNKPSELWA